VNSEATDLYGRAGPVYNLHKLILSGISDAVPVSVAELAVWRISKILVDTDSA
jgi:hypothetical protein